MGDFSFMNAQIQARLSDGFVAQIEDWTHDFDQVSIDSAIERTIQSG